MKRAVIISLAAHAALILFVLFSGRLFYDEAGKGGHGGGVVSVWVSPVQGEIALRGRAVLPHEAPKGVQAETAADGSLGGDGGGAGGGIGAGAGQGVDGDPVLAEIWRKINRAKRYPETAKRRGLEGAPKVEFAIASRGEVEWVRLSESCGVDELDKAAIETIRRAGQFPYYPRPIALAVRYSLDD